MNLAPNQRQQLLLVVALVGAAIFIGDRLVISPLFKAWDARSKELAALRKQIAQGRQLLERRNTVLDRWDQMRTNALPNVLSAAEGRVLDAFDRWARSANVNITSIKPRWRQLDDDHMTFECNVDATGPLPTITRFLYEVERDSLPIRVENVELATRETDASLISVSMQISGLFLNSPTKR
jgi:hypothetical protein